MLVILLQSVDGVHVCLQRRESRVKVRVKYGDKKGVEYGDNTIQ